MNQFSDRLKTIKNRLLLKRVVVGLSAASAVGVVVALTVGFGAWLWALILGPVGALMSFNESRIPSMMDRIGGHDGQVQCAADHLDKTGPVIVAQRARAVASMTKVDDAVYAPRPSALYFAPMLCLLLLGWPSGEPETGRRVGSDGESGGPVSAEVEIKSAKPRPPEAPSVVSSADRIAASKTASAPEESSEAGRAAVGAETGDMASGQTQTTVVRRVDAGRDIELDAPLIQGQVASHESAQAIAEPARPFPKRYRPMISAWFSRRAKE